VVCLIPVVFHRKPSVLLSILILILMVVSVSFCAGADSPVGRSSLTFLSANLTESNVSAVANPPAYFLRTESATGNPATIRTELTLGQSIKPCEAFYLAVFNRKKSVFSPDLSVTWRYMSSGWLRGWMVLLESSRGLTKNAGSHQSKTSRGRDYIPLCRVSPQCGHSYRTTFSWDPGRGLTSVLVVDTTLDEEIYAGEIRVATSNSSYFSGAGLEYSTDDAPNAPCAVIKAFSCVQGFIPAGVDWGVVELEDDGTPGIRVSRVDRWETTGIELNPIHPNLPGHYGFYIGTEKHMRKVAAVPGDSGAAVIRLQNCDLPIGGLVVKMNYTYEDEVQLSRQQKIKAGSANLQVRDLQINQYGNSLQGNLVVAADGRLKGVDFGCTARISGLTWEKDSCLPKKTAPEERIVLFQDTLMVDTSETTVPFQIFWPSKSQADAVRVELEAILGEDQTEDVSAGEVVWAQNTNQLAVAYDRPKSYDLRCMTEVLQGIVNREGARLYLLDGDKQDEWLDIYATRNNLSYHIIDSLSHLISYFRDSVNGLAVYDEQVDGSRYVALTAAGLEDLLPVSQSLLNSCGDLFARFNLEVIRDFRGKFSDSVEAYEWALENIMPDTNRNYAHAVNGKVDGVVAGCGPFAWFDWVIMHRGFIFNLSCAPLEKESYGYPVGGSREQAEVYSRILSALEPMAQIRGYGEPEWDWVALLSHYGHYSFHWGGNLSFHSQIPAARPLQQQQHFTAENLKQIDEDKHYVVFMTSEGDTMKGPIPFWSGSWFDPARGSVAMNWGINPLMAEITPAMLEYYYDTATDSDYFFAGTSGAGYTFLKNRSTEQVKQFAELTAEAVRKADIHVIDVWNWGDDDKLQLYADVIDPQGLTLLHTSPPNWIGDTPAAGQPLAYWNASHTDLPKTVPEIAQRIKQLAARRETPSIITVYTDMHSNNHLPELHRNLAGLLDDDEFKVVRLDEAFAAMRLHRIKKNPESSR